MLQTYTICTHAHPELAVIWLHGLGATFDDFSHALPLLGLPKEARIQFVFVQAPDRPVTLNQGYRMPAWYDIAALSEDAPEDAEGLLAMHERFSLEMPSWLKDSVKQVVWVGFSQGAAMSLYHVLCSTQAFAAVIALSGYLPLAAAWKAHPDRVLQKKTTPIMLLHGEEDEVLPLAFGEHARDTLRALGFSVFWQTFPVAHTVSMEAFQVIGRYLSTMA